MNVMNCILHLGKNISARCEDASPSLLRLLLGLCFCTQTEEDRRTSLCAQHHENEATNGFNNLRRTV